MYLPNNSLKNHLPEKYHLNRSVHVSQEQKKIGRPINVRLTIEALHRLQVTIYCMFQDKGATAIQLEATNLSSLVVAKFTFPLITYFSTIYLTIRL